MNKHRPGKTTFVIRVSLCQVSITCRPPKARHPQARPTLKARSLPSHHLRTRRPCASLGPAALTRGITSGTSAWPHAGHRGRGERDQQALRAAHLHTPRPLPGCPGCRVLPLGARDLLTPPETRRWLARGARGRAAANLDVEWEPGKTRDRSASQLKGWVGTRV